MIRKPFWSFPYGLFVMDSDQVKMTLKSLQETELSKKTMLKSGVLKIRRYSFYEDVESYLFYCSCRQSATNQERLGYKDSYKEKAHCILHF